MFGFAFPAGATITVMVEIFSQSYRPSAFLIVGCINWMGLFVLGMIFPVIVVSDSHRTPLSRLIYFLMLTRAKIIAINCNDMQSSELCSNTKSAQKYPRFLKEQQTDSGHTWPVGTPGLIPVPDCVSSTPLNLNF